MDPEKYEARKAKQIERYEAQFSPREEYDNNSLPDGTQKDYSKYFKIIIALLLIPYILRFIAFLYTFIILNEVDKAFEQILNTFIK